MKIKNINKKDNLFEYFIDLDLNSDLWKKCESNALKRIGKNVKIDGYRPGKVPVEVLKKSISSKDLLSETYPELCSKLTKELEKQKEFLANVDETIEPMYPPMVSIENEKPITDTISFKFTYARYFKIDLKDYKNWKLKSQLSPVTDKEINEEINRKLSESQMVVPKDGAIENGDIAVINFKGFIDGVAFPGGEATNYELKIGSKSFIDNFEDQLIGLKQGDSKDVNVTFPKDYHAKEFAGKQAKFEVKINAVCQVELPKLDDEFVKEQNIESVKNVDEYKKYISKTLEEANKKKFDEDRENEIFQNIESIAKFDDIQKEVPKFAIDTYLNVRKIQMMKMFGIKNFDQWKESLKASGVDVEAFENMQNSQYTKAFIINLITRQIALNEKINPTKADIDKKIDEELQMTKDKKEFNVDERALLSSVIKNEMLAKDGRDFIMNFYIKDKSSK